MPIDYQSFLKFCDRAVAKKCPLDRADLADCVDPANFFEEGMTPGEASKAADEFADELLEQEGFPAEDSDE